MSTRQQSTKGGIEKGILTDEEEKELVDYLLKI